MDIPKSYTKIREELLHQHAQAKSNILRQLLAEAIDKTESSYYALGVLDEAFQTLLVKLDEGCLPGTMDKVGQYYAAVEVFRQYESEAREQLLHLDIDQNTTLKRLPIKDIPIDASPIYREWLGKVNKLKREHTSIKPAPESLKEEIETYEHAQKILKELASTTMLAGVTANTGIIGVLAVGNLWLQHVLLDRIYDTKKTSFEQYLDKSKKLAILETFSGQLLGLLPGFGLASSFGKLLVTLRDLRGKLWSDTDSSLKFIETYLSLHAEWNANCNEYSKKFSEAVKMFE
jgi:hypothetical protein